MDYSLQQYANQLRWAFARAMERYRPEDAARTRLRADMDPLSML